jgi:hypothetical protein
MYKAILGSGFALFVVQVGLFLSIEADSQRNIVDNHRNIGVYASVFAEFEEEINSDAMKKSVKKTSLTYSETIDSRMKQTERMWSEARTWLFFPEHLAGAFSGGFGEQSCYQCHFDYDLNMAEGVLELNGIDERIEAGESYELEVFLARPDLGAAGFQLTARFEDGSQAGSFTLNDEVIFTPNTPGEVEYLQHAIRNIEPENGTKSWKFTWTAPADVDQPIIFNLAGNAANGDESAFGDWILTREQRAASREQ